MEQILTITKFLRRVEIRKKNNWLIEYLSSWEYVISLVLSHHNTNLKRWTLKPSDRQCLSSRTDQCFSSVLQLSFIYKIKENTSSRHEHMPTQKTQREERDPHPQPFSCSFFFLRTKRNLFTKFLTWLVVRTNKPSTKTPLTVFKSVHTRKQPLQFLIIRPERCPSAYPSTEKGDINTFDHRDLCK